MPTRNIEKSNTTNSPLMSEDWDFTELPQEEYWIAEIYEYTRECQEVSDAFSEWLDGEAVLWEEFVDQVIRIGNRHNRVGSRRNRFGSRRYRIESYLTRFRSYNTRYKRWRTPLNLSIRKLIKKAPLPRTIKVGKESVKIDWGNIVDMADIKLVGHPLFRLLPLLQEWPKPYIIARKSGHVKQGIDELIKPPSADRKAAVLIPDEKDYFDCPFGLVQENLQRIELLIDFSRDINDIIPDIRQICAKFRNKKKGRDGVHSSESLKQLGALRLRRRGYGKDRSIQSYDSLEIQLLNKREELKGKKHCNSKLLPYYKGETIFIAGGDKAITRLLNYRKYNKINSLSGSVKEMDFD